VKTADWKRTVRPLIPVGESWEFRGRLCYRVPVDRILLGILAEGSAFDRVIYIWRVRMPLFIPSSNVTLTWSERMGGPSRSFGPDDPEAMASAVRLAFGSLGDEAEAIEGIVETGARTVGNSRVDETLAYCHVLLGDLAAARRHLALASAGTTTLPWAVEVQARARQFAQLLDHDEGGAVAQLDRWCAQTAAALGLQRGRGCGTARAR
jgi:hypothetical protein